MTPPTPSSQSKTATTTTTTTEAHHDAAKRLMHLLISQYELGWVTSGGDAYTAPAQKRVVDHPKPLYELRRAEDLRAGDIIWWNNSEVVITQTNVFASVAERNPVLRVHYLTRLLRHNTFMLRPQVVVARVRRPFVTPTESDPVADAVTATFDASHQTMFWDSFARAMLVDDGNVDDDAAGVVWRYPRIARVTPEPFDPTLYDDLTDLSSPADDRTDDDHDGDDTGDTSRIHS